MNLHRSMTLFVEVAREGNLAAAGRRLNLSPPSASRLLNDFEGWLGKSLVRRTTRHVSLTELGERYLPRCIDILENTEALKTNAAKHTDRPTGRLRVTVAGILARKIVTGIIPKFLAENPSVTLQLDTTDRPIDLMSEKMDVAIRVGHLEDSSLVARKICETRLVLVASPAFLNRRGMPVEKDDLTEMPCLIDTVPRYGARWPFLGGKMISGPAEISDGEVIRDLAVAGLGIAYLPELLIDEDLHTETLIEVLPGLAPETLGIYAVFPPRDYISAAALAFSEAVKVAMPSSNSRRT
jgi:DNA-binding transcriptional LysR family regulator